MRSTNYAYHNVVHEKYVTFDCRQYLFSISLLRIDAIVALLCMLIIKVHKENLFYIIELIIKGGENGRWQNLVNPFMRVTS